MLIQNALYRVLNVGVVFLTTLVISRLIGVNGYGSLTLMITNAAVFNMFTSFGADAGIAYHAAAATIPKQKITGIIHWILLVQLLLLTLAELISYVLYSHFWLIRNETTRGIWLAWVFICAVSLAEKYSALLNGRHLFSLNSLLLLYGNLVILATIGIFYFVFPGISLNDFLFVYVWLCFLQALVFMAGYYRHEKTLPFFGRISKSELKLFFNYSLITLAANAIQFLAYRIDYWILGYYRGEKELGWYSLAVKLVQFFWIIPLVFAAIILPGTAAAKRREEERMLPLLSVMFWFNMTAGVILFFAMPWIIPFLFGAVFDQSVLLFRILLPGVIFFVHAIILAAYFAGVNRLRINLFASSLCFIVILLLDILLIPLYGMVGAAIASSIGYGITAIFYILKYNMDNHTGVTRFFWPRKNDWKNFLTAVSVSFIKRQV